MKVKDFIKIVENYPDFDLVIQEEKDDYKYGINLTQFEIDGIDDIGHSDKLIIVSVQQVSE